MPKAKKTVNSSPKFRPGDQVMFVRKAPEKAAALIKRLANDLPGISNAKERVKSIIETGITTYHTILFVVGAGDEGWSYGVFGVEGVERLEEEDLSPINY